MHREKELRTSTGSPVSGQAGGITVANAFEGRRTEISLCLTHHVGASQFEVIKRHIFRCSMREYTLCAFATENRHASC